MRKSKVFWAAIALGGLMAAGTVAQASVISGNAITLGASDIGTGFTVTGSQTNPSLGYLANFSVASLTSSTLDLNVTLYNTTSLTTSLTQAALMSIGMSVDPNASAVSISGGTVFTSADMPTKQNFPGGFKEIDVCAYAANGCSGGDVKEGLQAGASDSFTLDLTGTFGTTPQVKLDTFPVKFQTNIGSYEFGSTTITTPTSPIVPVPEPGSLALLGSGLLGLGLVARRRTRMG